MISDCVPFLNAYRERMSVMEDLFGVQSAEITRVKRTGVWSPSLTHPHWFMAPAPENDEDAVVGENITGNVFGESFFFRTISPRSCEVTTGQVLLKDAKAAPVLIRKRSGQGQAFLFAFSMQDTNFEICKHEDLASRADLQRLFRAVTTSVGVAPNVFSSNPDIEACLRVNFRNAYLFVINHEAADARTRVHIAGLEFPVTEIFNLTEGHKVGFREVNGTIIFDAEAPRERPQLLRLLAGTEMQPSIGATTG